MLIYKIISQRLVEKESFHLNYFEYWEFIKVARFELHNLPSILKPFHSETILQK